MEKTTKKDKKPQYYARAEEPTIQAIIFQMFRFTSLDQAKKRLEALKDTYIISKHQIDGNGHPSVILWIKGFSVTPEEEEKGFFGNYALISIKELEGGKFALYALKLETELKRHPQRKFIKRGTPNWGHPLLRKIKMGKIHYDSVEDAQDVLMKIHEDYPDVSIPTPGKLYIIIYSSATKPPVKKYVLEIKANEAGKFWIDSYENARPARKKLPRDNDRGRPHKENRRDSAPAEEADVSEALDAELEAATQAEEAAVFTPTAPAEESAPLPELPPDAEIMDSDDAMALAKEADRRKQSMKQTKPSKQAVGKFTAQEELKRQKKKKK